MLAAIQSANRTVTELAADLYPRPLKGAQLHFVMAEILAYLAYLEVRGRAERVRACGARLSSLAGRPPAAQSRTRMRELTEGHMTIETPRELAEYAASVLAPETDLLADDDVDIAGLGRAVAMVFRGALAHPAEAAQAGFRYAARLAQIPPVAWSSWLGSSVEPPVPLNLKDRRFADRTWSANPAFYSLRMSHQAFADFMDQMVTAAGLERIQETKARLLTGLMVDALAPTNFLLTNPAALKSAFETGGASVAKGARNFVDDLINNHGRPRQVDTSNFILGKNLAATPGKVVYRNELMELIQYSAQTAQVHAAPLPCSPPWINKYYVMDLAPARSFIEWAIKHERTVFAISYRNPSPDMYGVTMDDYLIHGPTQALKVIQKSPMQTAWT